MTNQSLFQKMKWPHLKHPSHWTKPGKTSMYMITIAFFLPPRQFRTPPASFSVYLSCLGAVTSGGVGEKKGQQATSQAEAERQQILNEMKKKTPLLTDSSWIRQRSTNTAATVRETDIPPMRRYSPRSVYKSFKKSHLCCVMWWLAFYTY